MKCVIDGKHGVLLVILIGFIGDYPTKPRRPTGGKFCRSVSYDVCAVSGISSFSLVLAS